MEEESNTVAVSAEQSDRLSRLKAELEALSSTSFVQSIRLVSEEIRKIESGKNPSMIDLDAKKPLKLTQKLKIPIDKYPDANFVGKLLGPHGSTLKKLQVETGCKLSIFGKGSVRDKDKEEDMRKQGGKYDHLNEDLHINIFSQCAKSEILPPDIPAAVTFERIGYAIRTLSKYFDPNFEDADQAQQMGFGPGARGRGGPRGRGPPRVARAGMRGRGGAVRGGGAAGGGPIAQQAYPGYTTDSYGGYGAAAYTTQTNGGYYYQGAASGSMTRGGGPMRGMTRGAAARQAPYGVPSTPRGGRGAYPAQY